MRPSALPSPRTALACAHHPAANGSVRLVLVGELDLVTADLARNALSRAQAEPCTLICDLGELQPSMPNRALRSRGCAQPRPHVF